MTGRTVWGLFLRQTTLPVHLQLDGDPAPTTTLRRALDDVGARYGLAADELFDLKVAATEALTNAIRGASDGRGVDVAVEPWGGVIDVEVRNRGSFELEAARRGDIDSEGGRGIALMFALVDEVEFASSREGTRVRMRKRVGRREQQVSAARI
jgi:serine/threonine-protein kinase RsbW